MSIDTKGIDTEGIATKRVNIGDEKEPEYTQHLKIRDIGLDNEGCYAIEVNLEAIHLSYAKLAHGGMIFTLLDAALGRTVMSHIPQGMQCPTVEMKINYFRPASSGKLTAKGKIINLSKTLCYAEGEVINEAGKLIARATGTFFIKPIENEGKSADNKNSEKNAQQLL